MLPTHTKAQVILGFRTVLTICYKPGKPPPDPLQASSADSISAVSEHHQLLATRFVDSGA